MTKTKILKMVSFVIIFCMILSLPRYVYAGKYFVHSSGLEKSQEIGIGYKFKFGSQEQAPKNDDKIEKLKQEDTKGAGTAVGLIILGACIVAAAVLIVNKADDITNTADDKVDELVNTAEQKYNEETQEEAE